MDSKADERRKEQEVATQARPFILEKLRERREPLEISRLVAEKWDVDERLSYRWAQYLNEDYQRQRRRFVVIGLIILWLGALAAVGGVVLSILSIGSPALAYWILGLLVGVPFVVVGALVIGLAGRFVKLSI